MKIPFAAVSMVLLLVLLALSHDPDTSPVQSKGEEPSVIRSVAPVFPLPPGGPNAVGEVFVEVEVNNSGTVTTARLIQGHPPLYNAAENAALRWFFERGDNPDEKRKVRLNFIFNFMDPRSPDNDLVPIFIAPYQGEVRRAQPAIMTTETVPRQPNTR